MTENLKHVTENYTPMKIRFSNSTMNYIELEKYYDKYRTTEEIFQTRKYIISDDTYLEYETVVLYAIENLLYPTDTPTPLGIKPFDFREHDRMERIKIRFYATQELMVQAMKKISSGIEGNCTLQIGNLTFYNGSQKFIHDWQGSEYGEMVDIELPEDIVIV